MTTIDSTPEMAARIYETSERNLQIVRRRLGRPLTLSEKVLLGHLDDPETAELDAGASYLSLRPDRVVFQDALAQSALLQFAQTERKRVALPTTIHCDHLIQARHDGVRDLREARAENREVYDFLRSAAAKFGIGFWQPGSGIIHQVVLENYAFPGQLIIGTDSHTPNAGGLGACAIGVGGADAVEAIAGMPWELLYPKRIAVYLTGSLCGWAAPKDVILYVAGQLTVSGGTNAIVEYIGPGARSISATGKATITNMGAEVGATTSMFPADPRMARYLEATGRRALVPIIQRYQHLLEPDADVEAMPDKYYDRVIELDLSTLEPHVVGPHSPDRVRPISKLAAEIAGSRSEIIDTVSVALIGSCTNSSYEDMSRAADIAAQGAARGVKAAAQFFVTPGSEQIRATLERDGQAGMLTEAGGVVLANACGPCIGQWRREDAEKPNTIVTSFNRNFPRRNDGRAGTMNFIASPEVVTAFALAGRLSFNPLRDELIGGDGKAFRLDAPKPAPDVPANGFAHGAELYVSPPSDGSGVALEIRPDSERLQLLSPWAAWDGQDFAHMPVLIKTKGKTTTDHISPAGVWIRYRGHLDKFSDNMFMGAVNAFDNEVGRVRNVLTGKTEPVSRVARTYLTKGLRWVAVGDWNYGEGSSREHAALSPRFLGGAAVIARSFARIHETNLKKQGLLALTFADPNDYDRVREDDRISLVGLQSLASGKLVECMLEHADGTRDSIRLKHSYGEAQIAWFRAGSALNAMRETSGQGVAAA
ncbi:MAG: aconitate hydratase [Alphaproteobacteria bacterium]|nr:aconitate hydratase [Alphaproteobacteria bacterium]